MVELAGPKAEGDLKVQVAPPRAPVELPTCLESAISFRGALSFRQRLALSLLTGKPITISDVRIRDASLPGLRPCEACLLEIVRKITTGAKVKVGGGLAYTDVRVDDAGVLLGCEHPISFSCPPDRGITYYLEFLLMVGPFTKHGFRGLELRGVTDHPLDMSIDSFRAGASSVWRLLSPKPCDGPITTIDGGVELPPFDVEVKSRGLLPLGGGRVIFSCGVFNNRLGCLKPVQRVYPGKVYRVRGVAYTCHMNPMHATRTLESARAVLNEILADVHIYTDICKGDKAGQSTGFGISLVAETLSGNTYVADGVVDKHFETAQGKSSEGNSRDVNYAADHAAGGDAVLRSEYAGRTELKRLLTSAQDNGPSTTPMTTALGQDVALRLLAKVSEAGVVDSGFQSVALHYMALADDTARGILVFGRLTPAAVSTLRTIKDFLGVEFEVHPYQQALDKARQARERRQAVLDEEDGAAAGSDGAAAGSDGAAAGTDGAGAGTDGAGAGALDVEQSSTGQACSPEIAYALQHNRFVVSCRGTSYLNISRPTF